MTRKDNIISFQDQLQKKRADDLRQGGRISVAHKQIEGLLHTEKETKDEQWEEMIKIVSLRDVGTRGLQVETDHLDEPDYVGTLVFRLEDEQGRTSLVDIDAKHTWTKIIAKKMRMGFRYVNGNDKQVKELIKIATQ